MENETNDKMILFPRWSRYDKMWTIYFTKHEISMAAQFSPATYFSTANEAHNYCKELTEEHPDLYELDKTFKR